VARSSRGRRAFTDGIVTSMRLRLGADDRAPGGVQGGRDCIARGRACAPASTRSLGRSSRTAHSRCSGPHAARRGPLFREGLHLAALQTVQQPWQRSGSSLAVNALATISAGLGWRWRSPRTPQQQPQQQQINAASLELLGCRTRLAASARARISASQTGPHTGPSAPHVVVGPLVKHQTAFLRRITTAPTILAVRRQMQALPPADHGPAPVVHLLIR